MRFKLNGVRATVVMLLAISAAFTGLFVSQYIHPVKKIDASQFHGTYLENPRAIKEFALTGIDNKSFSNSSLRGHWTLLFFGFTNCGYVCPTTMAELSKMYHILQDKKVTNLPQIVMVSIDPQRDSIEKLNHYVTSFQPSFYGASGEEKIIKSMTHEMGVAYIKVVDKNNPDSQNYDMQHSGAIMLFNPKGELNAFFTTPHHADLLAKDYLLLAS